MSSDYRATAISAYRVYLSTPDTPEGKNALALARRYAKKIGTTLEELFSGTQPQTWQIEEVSLGSMHWEQALADLAFASMGLRLEVDIAVLECQCTEKEKNEAVDLFLSMRREVLQRSGDFCRRVKMRVDISSVDGALDIYRDWYVIGIGERMLKARQIDDHSHIPRWDALTETVKGPVIEVTGLPSGHRGVRYTNRSQSIVVEPGIEGRRDALSS